jgi:hypothetical protein
MHNDVNRTIRLHTSWCLQITLGREHVLLHHTVTQLCYKNHLCYGSPRGNKVHVHKSRSNDTFWQYFFLVRKMSIGRFVSANIDDAVEWNNSFDLKTRIKVYSFLVVLAPRLLTRDVRSRCKPNRSPVLSTVLFAHFVIFADFSGFRPFHGLSRS